MIITNNLDKYLISYPFEAGEALKKIEENSIGGLIVTKQNKLYGSITDGDIRRGLMKNGEKLSVDDCINLNPQKSFTTDKEILNQIFLKGAINFIPVLNDFYEVKSVSIYKDVPFKIGNIEISKQENCKFIAEIGNNHNGDINLAKEMIQSAKEAGADIVKFQMRQMENIYSKKRNSQDLGVEYTLDLLSKNQLSNEELFEIFDYAESLGVLPLCTPWDEKSADLLLNYGIKAFKVASADLTNHPLIKHLSEMRLPLILSTGMSLESEIIESKNILEENGSQFMFLHCNSTYPAPFKDLNLKYIKKLEKITSNIIGYSSHERGYSAVLAAITLGAKLIEKHFTFDKSMEGVDHKVSLLPEEFKEMKIRSLEVESSLGMGDDRTLSQGEVINRENLSKSIFSSKKIKKGEIFSKNNVFLMSPGSGMQPNKLNSLLGKTSTRDIESESIIYESDFNSQTHLSYDFSFRRPWGFPVRYHDINTLYEILEPKLLEIHLSYSDLQINLNKHLKKNFSSELVVHAPELFESDFVLDLCTKNKETLDKSINYAEKVINHSLEILKYFPNTKKPKVIFNVGGFSDRGFLSNKQVDEKYDIFAEAFKSIDTSQVQFLPQSMPPFPWHFGGQQFHNLFNESEKIKKICDLLELNICLDISHASMFTTYKGINLSDYVSEISPYISHMHLSDSTGTDGEGIQIGEGDINWQEILKILDEKSPKSSFIPEVWQSHKNSGEGIWVALNRLNNIWN